MQVHYGQKFVNHYSHYVVLLQSAATKFKAHNWIEFLLWCSHHPITAIVQKDFSKRIENIATVKEAKSGIG